MALFGGKRPSGIECVWEEKRNGDVVLHARFPDGVAGSYLKSLNEIETKLLIEHFMLGLRNGARAIRDRRNPPRDPGSIVFGQRGPLRD